MTLEERLPYLSQKRLRRHIRATLARATPAQYDEGLRWYHAAHTFARGLSQRYGVTVRQACGIIAALSPQTRWERNMVIADTFCRIGEVRTIGTAWKPARRIFDGEDPADVLHGPKTRAFFANIVDPDGMTEVTIDRHACDLACNNRRGHAYRPELRRVGGYEAITRAYVAVAASLGMVPSTLQAITWLVWKG